MAIVIPSFDFKAFYYDELKEALLEWKRINVPEITDESPYDPFNQSLTAYALVGHLNNTWLTFRANELMLPTATRLQSVKNLLKLIDYDMSGASPAVSEVLLQLTSSFSFDQVDFVPALSIFSTEATEDQEPIDFEVQESMDLDRTDHLHKAYGAVAEDTSPIGIDGEVVVANTFKSAAHTFTPNDEGKWIRIERSTLGNNKVVRIATYVDADEVTVEGTPFASAETNLYFTLCAVSVNSETPTRISIRGGSFDDTHIGHWIELNYSIMGNSGRYIVAGVPLVDTLELQGADFLTEEALAYTFYRFTSDGAEKLNTDVSLTYRPWPFIYDKNELYISHRHVMWDRMEIKTTSLATDLNGVWEYYDGVGSDTEPDEVVAVSGSLKFTINTFLKNNLAPGTWVDIVHLPTGVLESNKSYIDSGDNFVMLPSYLGQVTPSTDPSDYAIGAKWNVLDFTDATDDFSINGTGKKVTLTLPQSLTERWDKVNIKGDEDRWLRYRIVFLGGSPVAPEIDRIKIDDRNLYMLAPVVQGNTVSEELGTGTGEASQEVTLTESPYIQGTLALTIADVEWQLVPHFLDSTSTSTHYRLDVDEDDIAKVIFGDGINGKAPPLGDVVAAIYRINANVDGNVGSRTIKVNTSGVSSVLESFNPRQAFGWQVKEGSTDASLAQAKQAGPAALRALRRGVSISDIEYLTEQYTNETGAKPIDRAFAIEEKFGLKTVAVIVVSTGGGLLSVEQRRDVEEYLNGDPDKDIDGLIVYNNEATVLNYQRRYIDVTATVTANGVAVESIRTALNALLSPLSLEEDGVTWTWDFGGEVPQSRIIAAIHEVSPNVKKVTLTTPATDISLGEYELPYPGEFVISII